MTKTYCVHIYPYAKMMDYENIQADSVKEATAKAVRKHRRIYKNEEGEIDSIEVMRQCDCGTDNDLDEKRCQDCGENL